MADWLKDFMGRTPFAILGAIGLLSMASQFINLADDIENWLKVWKAVTRPVWEWVAALVGYELPNWLKDYLTFGVIHAGMAMRLRHAYRKSNSHVVIRKMQLTTFQKTKRTFASFMKLGILPSILWPINLASNVLRYSKDIKRLSGRRFGASHLNDMETVEKERTLGSIVRTSNQKMAYYLSVYVETLIYFIILLAASGALILVE